jgi:DNA replication protein DnaC
MKRLEEILSAARHSEASATAIAASPNGSAEPAEPECPICGGAGFVRRQRILDDPLFGKAEPCACVLDEANDVRRSRLERISNLGTLVRFTFAAFQPGGRDGESARTAKAFEAASLFAESPTGWLVLTGPSGSGKTHLAAAIANRRIELGEPVLFMVVPDLLDHLRASYDADENDLSFDQLFEQVKNAPLLILDDLDATSPTAWAKEKLYQLLNHRFNAELPTVFTTTARPGDLDERVKTRLADERLAKVLVLDGAPEESGGYFQVGGMARDRLAEMMFRDIVESSQWSETERASFRAAATSARKYAEEPYGWLVIRGENGCGKTHLASAIANKALTMGMSVFFAVVPDLLDHLRASFAPTAPAGYDEIFDRVRNADLLVLDDLGAQQSSPWAEEKLYQIVNYRTLSHLPTVVTTNLQPQEFQRLHARLYSRIMDPHAGQLVEILTPHYALGRAPGRSEPPRRGGRAR